MWKPCLFITPPGSSLSLFHELPEQNSQQQCTLEHHFLVGKSMWAYIISLKLHKEPRDVCITTVLILQTGMLALLRAEAWCIALKPWCLVQCKCGCLTTPIWTDPLSHVYAGDKFSFLLTHHPFGIIPFHYSPRLQQTQERSPLFYTALYFAHLFSINYKSHAEGFSSPFIESIFIDHLLSDR